MVKGRPPHPGTELLRRARALEDEAEAALRRAGIPIPARSGGQGRARLDRQARLEAACRAHPDRAAEALDFIRRVDLLRWTAVEQHDALARHLARMFGRAFNPEDALQEARIGLLKTARRFDPELGIRFSTYARWWVRAVILRELDDNRLSAGAREVLRNARRAEAEGATDDDAIADRIGVPVERLRELRVADQPTVSLDAPVGPDGDRTLHELVAWEGDELDPLAVDAVRRAVTSLPKRLRTVVALRFGLDTDGDEATLAGVGRALGVSRERARQLEREALDELSQALRPRRSSRKGVAGGHDAQHAGASPVAPGRPQSSMDAAAGAESGEAAADPAPALSDRDGIDRDCHGSARRIAHLEAEVARLTVEARQWREHARVRAAEISRLTDPEREDQRFRTLLDAFLPRLTPEEQRAIADAIRILS